LYAILLPLAVVACATRPAPASSQEASGEVAFEMPAGGGTLHGTLLLPAGSAPSPVALIIAGSGPTDRNGNSPLLPGQHNSLRLPADGPARQGIATLRYDKRGIAESAYPGLREADLRFNTYVGDAVALLSRLRGDARFSRVSIVGHSEGRSE